MIIAKSLLKAVDDSSNTTLYPMMIDDEGSISQNISISKDKLIFNAVTGNLRYWYSS